MTPVSYSLGYRTGTCFLIVNDRECTLGQQSQCIAENFYGNIKEAKSSLMKIAFSIILFVPGFIIGMVFKEPALICSEKLTSNYKTFKNLTLEDKAYHELRIGISLKSEAHVNSYSKYVEEMKDPITFLKKALNR